MKLKQITAGLFVVATLGSSHAALITLNNGAGNTASGIRTTTGGTFRSGTTAGDAFTTGGGTSAGPGVVAIGFFTTDSLSTVNSPASLISLFVQFGNAGTFAAAGATGSRSVFSSAQNVTVGGTQFADKFIYLFAGNGTTFANSTEFLVVKHDTVTFGSVSDANPAPTAFTLRPDVSTALFGSEGAIVQTANTDGSATVGWTMAAPVPEPSAALLGLLGIAGLIRRRR
jgi:hypothetical protein